MFMYIVIREHVYLLSTYNNIRRVLPTLFNTLLNTLFPIDWNSIGFHQIMVVHVN